MQRRTKIVLGVAGAAVYLAGVAAVMQGKGGKEADGPSAAAGAVDRLARFDAVSGEYDARIGMDEIVMLLPLVRRFLVRQAQGDVLEVACGTGRNASYYRPDRVASLTAVDASRGMLDIAQLRPHAVDGVVFRAADAQRLPFADDSFDTVVMTFATCSMDEPRAALAEAARVCRPSGRILLLEHGLGHYAFLNRLLDTNAARHEAEWGCTWNRDIARLVDDAQLDVQSYTRLHFGTTHMIVARPPA